MPRKTIDVDRLREMTNHYLASEDSTPDGREATASLLEAALFETKRYAGFRYLEQEMHEDGTVKTLGCGSRRFYFIKEA